MAVSDSDLRTRAALLGEKIRAESGVARAVDIIERHAARDRLLAEQLPDGGQNCQAANGSTRSSFNTAICA